MTPARWGLLSAALIILLSLWIEHPAAVAESLAADRAAELADRELGEREPPAPTPLARESAAAGGFLIGGKRVQVPPPSSADPNGLARRVDSLVEQALADLARDTGVAPGQVRVGLHVIDALTGAELAARSPDVALRPASNMKLLTTAAALVHLGEGGEFQTRFELAGKRRGDTFVGDLVVRAGGDPLYREDDPAFAEKRLSEVAQSLREAGIKRIEGQVWLDEGSFAEPGPGPEWPPQNQFWQESCALAGGFSAAGSILTAHVTPGSVGSRARVEVHPTPPGLREKYKVSTVSKRINDVRVGANASGVTVTGSLGRSVGAIDARFSHPDPVGLFASVLLDQLSRGGIDVTGGVRRERGAPNGKWLMTLRTPMKGVLEPINTHSVNSVADHLFLATALAVSGEATRDAGEAATRKALQRLGVTAEGLRQVDGSGLSRANRVSARQLTSLLRAVRATPSAEAYRDSLAVAGRTGTLSKRMRKGPAEGRVWAKTGWIRGASAIAGFAWGEDGTERIVSILVSYPKERSGWNTRHFKPMQDRIFELVVGAKP